MLLLETVSGDLSSNLMEPISVDKLSTTLEMLPAVTLLLTVPLVSFFSLDFPSLTFLLVFRPSVPNTFLTFSSLSWAKTEDRKLLKEAWSVFEFVPSKGMSESESMITSMSNNYLHTQAK